MMYKDNFSLMAGSKSDFIKPFPTTCKKILQASVGLKGQSCEKVKEMLVKNDLTYKEEFDDEISSSFHH